MAGAVNQGMSGGPVLNTQKEVVGVNVAHNTQGELMSYLVPIYEGNHNKPYYQDAYYVGVLKPPATRISPDEPLEDFLGIAFVNDWDYIMNFRRFTDRTYNGTPGDGGVTTCHYKVKFDRQGTFGPYKVTGTAWKEQGCPVVPDPLKETIVREIAPAPAPPPPAQESAVLNLNADALFAFDKWTLNMTVKGKQELARLTSFLSSKQYDTVELVGHTDQLGSDSYNQRTTTYYPPGSAAAPGASMSVPAEAPVETGTVVTPPADYVSPTVPEPVA
ncbi:unnamed protein product, partial [Darwinula stevensoni]